MNSSTKSSTSSGRKRPSLSLRKRQKTQISTTPSNDPAPPKIGVIRIKAFAKTPLTPPDSKSENSENGAITPPADPNKNMPEASSSCVGAALETICVSSDEEAFEPVPEKKAVKRKVKNATTPKKSRRKRTRTESDAGEEQVDPEKKPAASVTPKRAAGGRKKQLDGSGCKKILDYFKRTPKKAPETLAEERVRPIPTSTVGTEAAAAPKDPVPALEIARENEGAANRKVRRRLCPGTDLHLVSNRYFDEDQTRMSAFYAKTKENPFGPFTVVAESVMPAIVSGEEDVERFLNVALKEEADRTMVFSQAAAVKTTENFTGFELNAVTERHERAQASLVDDERDAWNMERNPVAVGEGFSEVEESIGVENEPLLEETEESVSSRGTRKRKVVVPPYKIIAGTTFAVDAFRFGDIAGVTHYFLTHFHADHYQGLKKSFAHPLICSPVTAELVRRIVRVRPEHIIEMKLHTPLEIDGITVVALDANHCPGAVMFAFIFPSGELKLHVGDFRATTAMESLPLFWNHNISTLYLDTTYLNSRYALAPQEECVRRCVEAAEKFRADKMGERILIVVGSYVIGKEKVWMALAERFNLRVWVEKSRRTAIEAIGDPNMITRLADRPENAQLHVVNMNLAVYDRLKDYLTQINTTGDHFSHILAFRPSGWEKKRRPRHQGNISLIGVEYSEHSSYDELRRFVSFLRPTEIISTVPEGANPLKTPEIPLDWYQGKLRPQRDVLQQKIHDFAGVGAEAGRKGRRMRKNAQVAALEVSEVIELSGDEDAVMDDSN